MARTFIHIQQAKFKLAYFNRYNGHFTNLASPPRPWHMWEKGSKKESKYKLHCWRRNGDWDEFRMLRKHQREVVADKDMREQLNNYYTGQ